MPPVRGVVSLDLKAEFLHERAAGGGVGESRRRGVVGAVGDNLVPECSLSIGIGVPGLLLHSESRLGQQGLEPARQVAGQGNN